MFLFPKLFKRIFPPKVDTKDYYVYNTEKYIQLCLTLCVGSFWHLHHDNKGEMSIKWTQQGLTYRKEKISVKSKF